ncbi:hypothetical protein AM1_C0237 (plasmid) [Acaryochloris marina MBIC11017]|uniref:Uncharacterized protein n=1 Tax=Acaryochloris marina (strain MBIC 11017) TaxID=329726 RepID=A8ZMX1_ACAM1|nr:hypothetical protein AM1_C0237 [Acaryochloris marina MBIC11017]
MNDYGGVHNAIELNMQIKVNQQENKSLKLLFIMLKLLK